MEGSAAAAIICRHVHIMPYPQANVLRDQYTVITPPIFPLLKVGERSEMQILTHPCLTCTYTDIPEPRGRYRTAGSSPHRHLMPSSRVSISSGTYMVDS